MGNVHPLPGAGDPFAQPEPASLNLSEAELIDASGGYVRAAEQLKALHERGFVRAWRGRHGKVAMV